MMKKRFWAMLLAVCMVISVLPTTALAAEDVNLDSKEIVMKFELDKKTYVISASTRNGTLQTGSSTELIGVALGSEGADPSLYTFYFKLVAGTTDQYYITLPYKGVTYYLTGNHDQYLATSSSDATVFSVEADEDGNISSITTEVEKKDHDHNNTTKEIQILCVDESNATTGGLEIESTDANGGAKDGHIAVTVTMAYNDITYQYSEGAPVGAPPLEGYGETHVLAGQTKTVKPAPSLSGYTFSGWETDDVTVDENGAFVMPANDVVFTGSWSANKYTLTIKYVYDNGETAEETHTEQVEYGKTYSVNSPAISGYTANQAVVSGTMPAKDVTVTVTYSPNTARVTYQYEGNVPDGAPALPEVATVTVGTEYKVAAAPTLAGYTFSGWKIDDKAAADFTMPAEDVTITGSWTENADITINYQSADTTRGTVTNASETLAPVTGIAKGSTAKANTGYHFVNWTKDEAAVGTNVEYIPTKVNGLNVAATYVANFAPNTDTKYTVEHYQQNLTDTDYTIVEADTEVKSGTTGATATATAKRYEGFTFDSTVDGTVQTGTIAGDGSTVLKLYYTRNEYAVEYTWTGLPESAKETVPVKQNYKYGAEVSVNAQYTNKSTITVDGNTYTFSGWKIDDKAAADFTMPAKDVTITGTWTKTSVPSTPIKPSAALYDTMYYFEQKDGSYMADEKKTARKAGEVGEEVIAAELTPIPNGYAYDPIVTAKRHTATVAVPTPVLGEDGKTVIGVNLTTVERYYSIDVIGGNEGGDGIPDKYQAIVTFKVVNGKWNDETTADKSIVVTLVNEANVWAADGSYTLTESDVPAVGEKPDTNFKAGSWGTPPVGEKITKEATYTYTYARNIEEVVPKAAAYKVEHYKQNADGTWPAEPTEFEFPLVGMIGENVAAVAKDYGKFYCVNEELSEMSGEVFKPFVAEGATEPSYLVLKVYYDLLEANVSITKKADKTSVRVGDNVTYTITVKNTGNVDLTDVKITDEFLDGGKGTKKTEGTWSVTTLKPGESIVAKLVYTTVSDDVNGLKNSAVVDADEIKDTDTTEEVDVKHEPITPVGPPKLNYEDHYAYIVGYPDGLVHPEKNITRAEVATIFFRMLLDESREYFWAQENDFSDVAAADWFNNAVSTLANANLINGYPDGSYRPNNNITRAEFATIAIRFFLDEDVEIEENNLSDVKDHWAEANINLAYALGLIEGYPDDTFRPDQLITRAEAMTIVNRVLKRAPHKDHLLEDMIEWPDNMDEDMWYYADVQEATNSHEFHMYEDKKEDEEYEIWTELLPVRDWAALEREWSEANSSKNPGEVVDINISTPEAGDEGSLKLN